VLAGAALGVATCAAVLVFGPALRSFFLLASPLVSLAGALAVHASLALLYPSLPGVTTTYRDTCSILGVSLGVWWAARLTALYWSHLPLAGTETVFLSVWIARVALGLSLVLAGHWLFKRVVRWLLERVYREMFGDSAPIHLEGHMPFLALLKFVSYIGIGFNALGLVPLAFYACGL
jgi:hypothetical protein